MNEVVGDYRLLEKLGEGAAGEVFLATPLKDKSFVKAGQPVALKKYKSEILKKAGQFERIDREFHVGSSLSHPNLVRIYEYSSDPKRDSAPHVVMEYVDGVPLDRWIEQYWPIPRQLLVRFTKQLLSGVGHLHANGTLHRDIKPQNIMVTSTFDLKIMDFGVVRVKTDSPLTPEDMFIGTIRNSSPEMLFGQNYDERGDLYSLGTVFYALLHGEQVFSEEKQFARLVSMVRETEPHFDTAAAQDEVAQQLMQVTERLLKKPPAERFAKASDIESTIEPTLKAAAQIEPTEPLHGYVATALTGLEPDARDAIMFTSSMIAKLSKDYSLYVYEPRKATDPLLHKDVDPSAVYRLDRKRVLAADVLFVVANRPSFGVGQEIEIATGCSVPTILLVRDGVQVSRMVTGSPLNLLDEIHYKTPEELNRKLRKSLARKLDQVRRWRTFVRSKASIGLGQKFAELRANRGYQSPSELAETIGVSSRLLEAFEQGDYQNVSVSMLEQLAANLGTTVTDLLGPGHVAPIASKVASDSNVRRLENTAKKLGWSAATFLELREDYQHQLAASGDSINVSDEQWVARHNTLEKRRLRETGVKENPPDLFGPYRKS
ncbi:MAG: protein kinase domain-containing protein [Betaproteobacteria bacterium]